MHLQTHVKIEINKKHNHRNVSLSSHHYGAEINFPESPSLTQNKRPPLTASPAEVIARALQGGHKKNAPRDPVTIITQSVEKAQAPTPPNNDTEFWPVWMAHQDYLKAHALRFAGGNKSDAEDALSEAMLKAANAFNKTFIHNQRSWLLRLVHNACMDNHRNYRRQNRLSQEVGENDCYTAPAITILPERSPEEHLMALQQMNTLKQAFKSLPDDLASPLILHMDERPDDEIANTFHVTKEVIRKRRQMARALLRRNMKF